MGSEATKNPPGGADSRHVMERNTLDPVTVAHVVKKDNMQKAWEQVRANKGVPGTDNISVKEFPQYALTYWEGIKESLLEETYVPSPVKRVEIPKDSGGVRMLGIPTVMDRVIQQAISQVLTPVFDPHFSKDSDGFRPEHSAHHAVRKVLNDTDEGEQGQEQGSKGAGLFTFKGKKLTATAKALRNFTHRLKRLTGRSWGISMQDRYGHIRLYVRGWMNYFGIGVRYTHIMELDHWLRRRIRMCYLKQWGRAKKRIGELIKLGSPKYQAILTGLSRKGYWHLAKTYSTNCGLSKQYLEDQGLVSLRTLWIRIHYPAKAR